MNMEIARLHHGPHWGYLAPLKELHLLFGDWYRKLGTVYSKRVAHSMLALIMCFFAAAGVSLMANAETLAAIQQILVYLGSVMLVFAFGVMLSRRRIHGGGFRMRLIGSRIDWHHWGARPAAFRCHEPIGVRVHRGAEQL